MLKAYSVVGPILSILESFLQERSLKAVLDGQCSHSPLISSMLGFLRDPFWGQPYSWLLLMIFPMRFYHSMQMTPLYSCLGKSDFFEKVESAGELELDLRIIVELGD